MDSFSPEFSTYWLREPVESGARGGTGGVAESLSPSQKAALEELAELVSAARSVV
ncbi:MAG TPA: hypothetical protein VEN29_15355 [Casimicrobiaceae bacterium]|nr:hypothetical protein [Casimicrobiaceae bacterium]